MASNSVMKDSRPATLSHINRVRELLYLIIAKLHDRAQVHDQSKLEEPEKSGFDKAGEELGQLKYGSKEYKTALTNLLGPALKHHYDANSHHPEHFKNGIRGMTLLDLVEMLADWKASGERVKDGSMAASLKHNKTRFKIPPVLQDILVNSAKEFVWLD
jgi:hypothetical protein